MKKKFRIIQKKITYILIKIINILIKRTNYNIIPSLDQFDEFNFEYSEDTRRLVLLNNKNRFNKITIDTSLFETELCEIGKKFNTNKSPYNLVGHRSGYTGVYYILFNKYKNKEFNFAEIGIEKNGSTKMWREYFTNASLYLFEKDENKIKKALNDGLKNTSYSSIDVGDREDIKSSFSKHNKKFDIIIDDSTHYFDHQINVIYTAKEFLSPGGILVIEDIFRLKKNHEEKKYYEKILDIKNEFSKIYFIETNHVNNFTANYKCEKLLVLIKS